MGQLDITVNGGKPRIVSTIAFSNRSFRYSCGVNRAFKTNKDSSFVGRSLGGVDGSGSPISG